MLQRMFTYLSDGSARTLADLGFRDSANAKLQVDWCLVKSRAAQTAVLALSSMPSGAMKELGAANVLITANGITLGLDSITLGTDVHLNNAGDTYTVWVGCCEAADSVVGTYDGNSAAGHVITTNLAADFTIICQDDTRAPVFWTTDYPAGVVAQYNVTPTTGFVTSWDATSFTLPAAPTANFGTGPKHYYYLQLKKVAGVFNCLKVAPATPTDNRLVAGVGFGPDLAIAKHSAASSAVRMRTRGQVGDDASFWSALAATTNLIQKMLTDGVEVGSDVGVNDQTGGNDIYWMFAAERTPYGGGGNRRLMGVGR